jgi:glycosyltransferase involved in cell wall biosynthesis
MQFVYDDLYAYSHSLENALSAIRNSRRYRIAESLAQSIPYRVAKKGVRLVKALISLDFAQINRAFLNMANRVRMRIEKKHLTSKIQKIITHRKLIIFPPTLDWHMPLFQRPQQLAKSYSKKEGYTVIYLTKNWNYDKVTNMESISDNLWVMHIGVFPILIKHINLSNKVILSISWTQNKDYVDLVKGADLIYEYIDELEIFDKYDNQMVKVHTELLKRANIVVCTASKLYIKAMGIAKNPILSTNGGDYETFSQTHNSALNSEIEKVIRGYKAVLGYYGALASWFDYELVKSVARKRPDWTWVLIGMDYDGSLPKSKVTDMANVKYLGTQDYSVLPTFLKAFSVATIPFVINEITLSTSPVKLFEYMAGGKPILTSKMPECMKYESVRTYSNADEFVELTEQFLALKSDDDYWDILEREAKDNTWDAKTDEILAALG